jgi:hypothetical protein
MNADKLNEKIRDKVRHCEYAEARELVRSWWEHLAETIEGLPIPYPELDYGRTPLLRLWFEGQGYERGILSALVFWFYPSAGWKSPIEKSPRLWVLLALSGICVVELDGFFSPGPNFPSLPSMDELFLVDTSQWEGIGEPSPDEERVVVLVKGYREKFGG